MATAQTLLRIVQRIQLASDSIAILLAADGLAGILGMDRNPLTADHEDLRLVDPRLPASTRHRDQARRGAR